MMTGKSGSIEHWKQRFLALTMAVVGLPTTTEGSRDV